MKYKNYRNPQTNDSRIYSYTDLYNMPFGELLKHKQEILGQYRVLGVPTEKELHESENVVYVESYTREDGTEVKAHYRSKPNSGSEAKVKENGNLTKGTSNIKKEDIKYEENKKNIPKMTKSAELQEHAIRSMPILEVKSNPEQEYYRIAFELKDAKIRGKISDWVNDHNDIRTLDKIGNGDLAKKIKEKIIEGANNNNDIDTLNNLNAVHVVTAKPDSNLIQSIEKSSYLEQEIDNRIKDIESGKLEKGSFSISFPNVDFSAHNVIGKCDVYNAKVDSKGNITATIIDYYDFDKNSNYPLVKNGYIQQQNGHLENYALVVPIRIKRKK